MIDLCKYKNIFGKPNDDIHSYRLFNIAIIDLLATIIVAWLLSYLFDISFIMITLLLLLMGIILHNIFCVKTTIDLLLFKN